MNPAQPATKPGPKISISIVTMIVGAVLVALGFVMVTFPIRHALTTAPALTAPGTARLHLVKANYKIYEPNPGSIGPADVTVTKTGGATLPVNRVNQNENIIRDGATYTSVLGFTAPATGDYDVTVAVTGRVLVTRSLTDLVRSRVGWVVAIPVGGLVGLVGLLMLIVGIVRRRQARRARPGAVPDGEFLF